MRGKRVRMLRAQWASVCDPNRPDAKAIFRSLKHNWPQMRHDFLVWAKAEARETRLILRGKAQDEQELIPAS